MTVKQGEIYWLELGMPRGSGPGYRHPHVVVQNNVFNASKISTVVVCALTSNLQRAKAPGNVLLKKGEGGLKKVCVVNVSQMLTVYKSDLVEKIGALTRPRIKEIVEGIRLLIESKDVERE